MNFCFSCGKFWACQNVWCVQLFAASSEMSFHIYEPFNDEGLRLKRNKDDNRFKKGPVHSIHGNATTWCYFPRYTGATEPLMWH